MKKHAIIITVLLFFGCSHGDRNDFTRGLKSFGNKVGHGLEVAGEQSAKAIGRGAIWYLQNAIEEESQNNNTARASCKNIQVYDDAEAQKIAFIQSHLEDWNRVVLDREAQFKSEFNVNSDYSKGYLYGWKFYKTNFDQFIELDSDSGKWSVGALQAVREIHLARLAFYTINHIASD